MIVHMAGQCFFVTLRVTKVSTKAGFLVDTGKNILTVLSFIKPFETTLNAQGLKAARKRVTVHHM